MTPPRRHRGPGRPKASQSRDRRADLIRAAQARFTEDGYNGATLSAIAQDAGLTLAALYHYFPDKLTLFETVYRHALKSRWEPWIEELESMDPAADIATKLRTTTRNPASNFNEDEVNFFPAAQIYLNRIPELRHLLEVRSQYRRRAFTLLVGTLAEEGRIRGATTTEEAVDLIELLFSGWSLEILLYPERYDRYFESAMTIAESIIM